MKKAWYTNKWMTILLHATAWILLFSLPALLRPAHNPNETKSAQSIDANIVFSHITHQRCIINRFLLFECIHADTTFVV